MKNKSIHSWLLLGVFILLLALVFPGRLMSLEKTETRKQFANVSQIQVNTFAGNCTLKPANGNTVEVYFSHTFDNATFVPKIAMEGKKLVLKEKLQLPGRGESDWVISIPNGVNIDLKSISGNITAAGLDIGLDAQTVSGKIDVQDCRGQLNIRSVSGEVVVQNLSGIISLKSSSSDMEIRQLSGTIVMKTSGGDIDADTLDGNISIKAPAGDIHLKNVSGQFEVKTATGDINVTAVSFTKESWFQAAAGDIYIELSKPLQHSLTLSSASGDAVLNFNGFPIEGLFEFRAVQGKGQISAPFPFEKEEIEERFGKKYIVNSFTRELDTPKIFIHTSSGEAILKEK